MGSAGPGNRTVRLRVSGQDKMIAYGEEMIMPCCRATPGARHHAAAGPAPGASQDGSRGQDPASTQTSLWQRLLALRSARWPQISQIHTRYRANFAYIDAVLADGDRLRLCRLRYTAARPTNGDSPSTAPATTTTKTYLPTGYPVGTAEEALDTACGLYLDDPTAWI